MQGLPFLANSLVSNAQAPEVLCSLWDGVAKEADHNAAGRFVTNLNVEVHLSRSAQLVVHI